VNVPNFLTGLRLLAVPVFIWLFLEGRLGAALLVFIFAMVTDWLDGVAARLLKQFTALGAVLDPVADKLIVVGALVVLMHLQPPRVDALVALVIIGREVAISALREWMAKVGQARSVAVAFIGKLKTVSQMIAIPLLLYHDHLFGLDCQWWGTILINVAAVLTVASMLYYLRKALPYAAVRS